MRLLTQHDFDGLACAAVLKAAGHMDSLTFVGLRETREGKTDVTASDWTANLPELSGCGKQYFRGDAPSCARVVFEDNGGAEKLPQLVTLLETVDRVASGKLTKNELENPEGWLLLGFLAEAQAGRGGQHFRISAYDLVMLLLDAIAEKPVEEILQLPDVRERAEQFKRQNDTFRATVAAHSRVVGQTVVVDLRGVERGGTGNRLLIGAIYPETTVSLWVNEGWGRRRCVISMMKSAINPAANLDVGALLRTLGGDGNDRSGMLQCAFEEADRTIEAILRKITE